MLNQGKKHPKNTKNINLKKKQNMKANIKKGKKLWVDCGPAREFKEFENEDGEVIATIKKWDAGKSRQSKKFKKVANRKVRYENFMNDENEGKTEKEMALEELGNRLEVAIESFIEDLTKSLKEFKLPDDVSMDEVAEIAYKTRDKCLKKFQESLK